MMASLKSLDYRRLGKQRAETKQLLQQIVLNEPDQREFLRWTLLGELKLSKPRLNHPACEMWWGHAGALAIYHDASIVEWLRRGYVNNMPLLSLAGKHKLPDWWGNEALHSSHRANLLRKDALWYGQHGWTDNPEDEYVWPTRN